MQEKIGRQAIKQQLQSLSAEAKKQFTQLGLLEDFVIKREKNATIFNLNGDEKLFHQLTQNGIICSQRGNGIRVSFHYYNTLENFKKVKK